ncbi:MAG: glycoside hydrolase family 2 TIM barrel-domain containing protein [Planctomycetota bacterium]
MVLRRNSVVAAVVLLLPVVGTDRAAEAAWTRLSSGWEFYQGDLGGPWEALRNNVKADTIEWTAVSLPHCYNALDAVSPDEPYYQGPAWYRRTIDCRRADPSDRVLIRFEAAGQRAEVYVGAKLVKEHVGGYDAFVVDITDALDGDPEAQQSVPLIVRCDNSRDLEQPPSDLSDFMLYGGLHRNVSMAVVPAVSLERVDATPDVTSATGRGSILLRCHLRNPTNVVGLATISATINAPDGSVVATGIAEVVVGAGSPPTPIELGVEAVERWSPDTPRLYEYAVVIDRGGRRHEVVGRFGFRTFRFEDRGPFYLNGERLLLRGTSRHEDHAGYGAAVPDAVVRREMRMIKAMGANFIRLGHYQQSDLVLDLCDELGLLVWEEIPWCRGGIGGDAYREHARRMLRSLITEHRNHPSVIIWGLGNENDWPGDFEQFDKAQIRSFMRELHDLAKDLDPGRLTAIRRCDFCKDVVDVYSPSIWAGWYRGRYTDYLTASRREMEKVRRFLHAEWGASQHAGRHSESPDVGIEAVASGDADERAGDFLRQGGAARVSRDGDWSETYGCNLIDWHLKEQERMPWLTGAAHWIFKDFATPLRPDNPIPYVNQKGVVQRDLTPKESYYVFQSYWAKEPMLRLYGHTWPVRHGPAGELSMIKVYSNCDAVELFVNGESAGTRRRDSANFPAAGLRWRVALKEGDNELVARAEVGGATLVDELRVHYQTRPSGGVDRLVLDVLSDSADRTKIRVTAVDTSGTRCLDAKNRIRFSIAGDGELVADLGVPGGSRVIELANGAAEAVISKGTGGAIVGASSEGLPSVFHRCERGAGSEMTRCEPETTKK